MHDASQIQGPKANTGVDPAHDVDLLARTSLDPDAFGTFYRRWERPVLAYFARRVEAGDLAADLAAETFAVALRSLDRFDKQRGEPAGWLFGIAHHTLARAYRRGRIEDRARRRLGLPVLELADDAVERIERLAGDQRVDELLEQLPAAQAEAVRSRILEEETYPEIAQRLRCSESVVRQRVSRGLSSLRKIVEEKS